MKKNDNFYLKNYTDNSRSKKAASDQPVKNPELGSQAKFISIFLIIIGIENASKIIKNFKKPEIEMLKKQMQSIVSITKKDIEDTEKKFGKIDKSKIKIPKNIPDYVKALFMSAFANEPGYSYFIKTETKPEKTGNEDDNYTSADQYADRISFLKDFNAEEIFNFLSKESPQVIAIVLSLLDAKLSADILNLFSNDLKIGIIKKISVKTELNPHVLETIIQNLKNKTDMIKKKDFIGIQGKLKLIEILKKSSFDQQAIIIEGLKETDPELAKELEEKIFTFDDLIDIPKKSLVYALKKYQDQDIAFILKGAHDDIKETFFNAISRKRKEIITDEIEYLGKVKKTDVDAKRFEFIKYLKELENAGKVHLLKNKEIYVD